MNYEKQTHTGLEIDEGELCQEDYLTNYMTFQQLLERYNKIVRIEFMLPKGDIIIRFRDSMAHGRTVTKDDLLITVHKYSKPINHEVRLEIKQELSKEYLESTARQMYESIRIVNQALSTLCNS